MIGYYVHHVGQGHLQRALSVAAASTERFTLLSSLSRPAGYHGDWLQLPRDDNGCAPREPTAFGQLHWAPLGDVGFQDRMALIGEWIRDLRPAAMVVDVSVEVIAFARLMGVRVVSIVQPGQRTDRAHQLGYALAEQLLAPWPESIGADLVDGLQPWAGKMRFTGAFSRFDGRSLESRSPSRPTVLVLQGRGGSSLTETDIASARNATPAWDWTALSGTPDTWVDDPWAALSNADVVVTHAGLNALAEVAAARKPAIVIPQSRAHEEQVKTARTLAKAGLVIALERWPPAREWPELIDAAQRTPGAQWSTWSTGDGAAQAAAIIEDVADPGYRARPKRG